MVRRGAGVLLALLLGGCPDDFGSGLDGVVAGLGAPTELAGVPNGGSEILLSWKDHATTETGYRLEMNPVPFGTPMIGGVEYLPADATSFVFPASPNSTYYFRVFAVTTVMESEPSMAIAVTTPDVPERPTGVAVAPASTTQLAVNWSDVSNETGYRAEVSSNAGTTWSIGSSPGPNSTQVVVPSLLSDTEYLVRMVAFNTHGDSTPSRPVRASTLSSLVTFAIASGADTGKFSSYQITPSGLEHLSHFDAGATNVLYTTRNPVGAFMTTTVDGGPTGMESVGGDGTSLAVDGAGKVHIVAHDQTNDRLRYITNASGSWVAVHLEFALSHVPRGAKARIIWDASSDGIYVYHYAVYGASPVLVGAVKVGPSWTFFTPVPLQVDPATTFSLAVDPLGIRHLAIVGPSRELRHVHAFGIEPTQPDLGSDTIPLPAVSSTPDDTAIAATGSAVHVVFHDASSGTLHHATDASGTWVTETVDESLGQDLGRFCAVAVHSATGRIHVAYYDATNRDLKYARKDPGGAWVRKVLDLGGDVGSHPSMVIDPAGAVHIAYRDETNLRLKIVTGSP